MAKESAILVRSVSPAAFLSLVPPAKSDAVWQSDSFFKKIHIFFKVNNHMDFSACKFGLYFFALYHLPKDPISFRNQIEPS